MGFISQALAARRGVMANMHAGGDGRLRLEYTIPTRGLIGLRSEFLTATRGNGIMNSRLLGYRPWAGEITSYRMGPLVALEEGQAVAYGLAAAQDRGITFVEAGTHVYGGMIVGLNSRGDEIVINVCKDKKKTNVRSSTSWNLGAPHAGHPPQPRTISSNSSPRTMSLSRLRQPEHPAAQAKSQSRAAGQGSPSFDVATLLRFRLPVRVSLTRVPRGARVKPAGLRGNVPANGVGTTVRDASPPVGWVLDWAHVAGLINPAPHCYSTCPREAADGSRTQQAQARETQT